MVNYAGPGRLENAPVIDTHLHFWNLEAYHRQAWLETQPEIHRTFLPEDLEPCFDACDVSQGIIVEAARDSHELNLWWLRLAKNHDFLGGVVVGCLLEQDNLATWLEEYSQYSGLRGVRTMPAGPVEEWPDNPATERGLRALVSNELSLDLLVGEVAFEAVAQLARVHPELTIILNHCARPPFREEQIRSWVDGLRELARLPNIYVKYSSLLYYAPANVSTSLLETIVNHLLSLFGTSRLMWGSNWPVELVTVQSYADSFRNMLHTVESLSDNERAAIFGGNAARIYRMTAN